VHQSTLTRTADRHVAGGWVRRETSSESRREVLVHLTQAGRALVTEGMALRRREIEAVLDSADERSRKAILRGFKAFAQVAGEPEDFELLSIGM
jgi:DNA-binding MarR family transcriptional regulator